ncbi:MAG: hypothetical protein AAF721_41490 [Myxococcota bacterium]
MGIVGWESMGWGICVAAALSVGCATGGTDDTAGDAPLIGDSTDEGDSTDGNSGPMTVGQPGTGDTVAPTDDGPMPDTGMETDTGVTDTGVATGTDGTTGGETDGTGTTGVTFEICELELPPPMACGGAGTTPAGLECNPIEQDCPDGEKCIAWASMGGNWDATRCEPIAENPGQVGDACSVEGAGTSGVDDCDIGTMCWDVDIETNMGVCIELCGCSYQQPTCDTPNTVCSISNEESLTLCNPVCNPLDPEGCGEGLACYPVGNFFQCAPDASGDVGTHADECTAINGCDAGHACVGAPVPGCNGAIGCCAQICHTDAGGCPAGTTCTAWYAPGGAPDECSETFGICVQ